jgi:hypothetical protein
MVSPILQKFGSDNFKGEIYGVFIPISLLLLPISIFWKSAFFYFKHKKGE